MSDFEIKVPNVEHEIWKNNWKFIIFVEYRTVLLELIKKAFCLETGNESGKGLKSLIILTTHASAHYTTPFCASLGLVLNCIIRIFLSVVVR